VTLTHEVVEATSDPDPGNSTAFTTTPGAAWPGPFSPISEFADNEPQNYSYRVNGTLVQSYAWDLNWPNDNTIRWYIVPDGNDTQNFTVDGGKLIVNGGQLPNNGGDNITIDVAQSGPSQGGVTVDLNGYIGTFELGAISSITVNTAAGKNHVYVKNTAVPVTINDGDNDTVDIGDNGNVQGIQAPVKVSNPTHHTTLIADNGNDLLGHDDVVITDAQITGLAQQGSISYTGTALFSLTIYGGHGINHYNVQSTPGGGLEKRGVPVTLNLGENTTPTGVTENFVIVGDPMAGGRTLDSIQGTLTMSGTLNDIELEDQGANAGHDYILGALNGVVNSLKRSNAAPIIFSNAQAVQIDGSPYVNRLTGPNQTNTWMLNGLNSGILDSSIRFTQMQYLTGGNQFDDFEFSGPSAGVSGMIDGGANSDNALDYQAYGAASTVSLGLLTDGWATGIGLGFTNIDSLVGDNVLTTLVGANATTDWSITGASAGSVTSVGSFGLVLVDPFSFQKVDNLVGGNGVDSFKFFFGGSIGSINGGGGGDWLDYSAFNFFNAPVTVNLTTGQATGVAGGAVSGVSNIQNVIGSQQGNDTLIGNSLGNVLIGGHGTNWIQGGSGRSLLIGGSGKSTIQGGSADDILIAGTTAYDANEAALMAILAEWQNQGLSYAARVAALSKGSDALVWGLTVFDNDAPGASVLGGGGQDWIFAGPNDH
jgi:hypothetical protein